MIVHSFFCILHSSFLILNSEFCLLNSYKLIETILLYKFTQLSREEVAQMLGLIDDDFRQTRMYRSIVEEGELKAKLEAVPRLLALGLSVEQIASALGLTIEQVQSAAQEQSS